MTAHAAIAAVPKTGTPNRTLLQALLVSRVAYILGDDEDPTAFDPRGEGGSPVTLVIGYRGQFFWFDEDDATTGHDGTTCIVTSATGGRYKVNNLDLLITSVISKDEATPPVSPSDGDAYIPATAATGAWSGWDGSIAVYSDARSEWVRILPKAGWFVSIPGATRDVVYRYDSVQADWITGDGALPGANTVPLSAMIGCGASLTIRVQNQTTYAPPGSRVTGATPAMALGGTAANINDNSDSTTGVTSALGDLTGAAVSARIVAKLSFAAAKDLITIEARGLLGSAASSASAMGLYYSTNNGSSWTQAGSGFTLSTSAQTVQRNGSFSGVTDVAVVTEAKNWSTNTHTIAGLNAFTADIDAAVGDAFVIASPAIGVLAGHEGKVAVCEIEDTLTIYTPAVGDQLYDAALGINIRWTAGSQWVSAAGQIIGVAEKYDALVSPVTDNGTLYNYDRTTAPTQAAARKYDNSVITYQAQRAGGSDRNLTLIYEADIQLQSGGTAASGHTVTVAVWDGANSDAIDWCLIPGIRPDEIAASSSWKMHIRVEFHFAAPDAASHDYNVGFVTSSANTVTNGVYPASIERRTMTILERA